MRGSVSRNNFIILAREFESVETSAGFALLLNVN